MATKIFVFGSINGQLQSAFGKLATLHAKNNFAFAIVAGNLFAETDDDGVAGLLDGSIKVPLPTYFTVGSTPLPSRIVEKIVAEEEICDNLHYLNKRSVTKTSEGVRIATLGGLLDTNIITGQSKEHHLPLHTADDAKALRGANSVDILLTTTWPASVWTGSRVNLAVDPASIASSDAVADLCAALKPKYHFSVNTSDIFYEREAFFHPPKTGGETSFDITRFLSLASFGNSSKAKAMYAFSLQTETVSTLPTGTTVSPFYQIGPKKRIADEMEGFSRFAREDVGDRQNKRRRNDRNRSPPPGPDRCFFCLSNPNLPTHMVCTIGEDAYIATAKGPLPSAQTFKDQGLKFPAHMIIVPLTHAPTLTTKFMGAEAIATFKECTRFRESLQVMVASLSKRKLGTVSWEISRERGIHPHWQVMPISADMVKRGLVEAAFQVEAENTKLPKLEEHDFGLGDEVQGDYFRVWIYAEDDNEDGGSIISKSLLMRFDQTVRFDLQFGRKVMAKLLGLDKRFQWRDCVQTEQEEKQDTDAVREAYKPWDFTI